MSNQWYIKTTDSEYGPYSTEQLMEYGREGRILEDDLVRNDVITEWVRAKDVPELVLPQASQAASPISQAPVKKKSGLLKFLSIIGVSAVALFVLLAVIGFVIEPEDEFEITSAVFATGVDENYLPTGITDTFSPDTKEIFVVTEVNTPEDINVTAMWFYEEGEDLLMDEYSLDLPQGATRPNFSYKIDQGWVTGSYRVELWVQEELMETVKFQVAGTIAEESATATLPVMINFSDSSLGYSISYPEHWTYERTNDWTVVFSGPEGTEEQLATVNMQNLASTNIGGIYSDLESVYQYYLSDIEALGGEILLKEEEVMTMGSRDVLTLSFLSYYLLDDRHILMWVFLVERNEDTFHQFSYTTPENLFDTYFDIAEEMFLSFELLD